MSKCHNCDQIITKKMVIKAIDAAEYIAEYLAYDDEKVWVAKDNKAICHREDVAHYTTKEWYAAQ